MPDFPEATAFGKKISRQKFYEHADVPASVRRMFAEGIESIVWRNKFSPDTLNIAAGEITEFELLHILLRQKSLPSAVLDAIARPICYPVVFMLEFSGLFQLRAAYAARGKTIWYKTAWLPFDSLPLALRGLSLDAVYENFVRQIAGDALPEAGAASLEEDVALGQAISDLRKRIASLAKKVKTERQFNRQAEYNRQLRMLRAELAALENGEPHAEDEM